MAADNVLAKNARRRLLAKGVECLLASCHAAQVLLDLLVLLLEELGLEQVLALEHRIKGGVHLLVPLHLEREKPVYLL